MTIFSCSIQLAIALTTLLLVSATVISIDSTAVTTDTDIGNDTLTLTSAISANATTIVITVFSFDVGGISCDLQTDHVIDDNDNQPCGTLSRFRVPANVVTDLAPLSSHNAALWRRESEFETICRGRFTVLVVNNGQVEASTEFDIENNVISNGSMDASACWAARCRFRVDEESCVSNVTWSGLKSISSGGCTRAIEPWWRIEPTPSPPQFRGPHHFNPPNYDASDDGGGWSVPLFVGGGGSCCCCIALVIICLCCAAGGGAGSSSSSSGSGGSSSSNNYSNNDDDWRDAQAARERERQERQEDAQKSSGNWGYWPTQPTPTEPTPTQTTPYWPESN